MESRGTFGDLVGGVGLQMFEVFDQGQEEYTPGISNLLITEGVTGAQENYSSVTGVGELSKFDGDGEDITTGRRYKAYTTKALWTNYAKSIEITKNQMEDNDFQAELDAMRDLGVAANFSQDKSGMQIFNGGFATTTNVNGYDINWYGDGEELFSTVHPTTVPGGSTQSNASSTGIKFGDDNLETARVAMTLQQTDDGIPLSLLGKETVVLPLNLDKEGQQVTMSEKVSENANNAINIYKGKVDMVTSIFLDATNGGSDTAWFLTVPGRSKLFHHVRQAPEMRQSVNERNLVSTFSVNSRWAETVKDYRRTWGSKGDLATYSS